MANEKTAGILQVDASSLKKISEVLGDMPREVETVVRRILYRVKDNARAEIVRQVPRVYAITTDMIQGALDRRTIHLSRQGEETVGIEVIGSAINLVRFPHSPGEPLYGNGSDRLGVYAKVMIIKSKGMQTVGGRWGKGFQKDPLKVGQPLEKKNPFLMRTTKNMSGAKVPYFFVRRTGEASKRDKTIEAVEPAFSLAIPQMVLNPAVAEPLQKYIEAQMAKRVDAELTNMVVKMQGRVNR